jgi:hypothetical protein
MNNYTILRVFVPLHGCRTVRSSLVAVVLGGLVVVGPLGPARMALAAPAPVEEGSEALEAEAEAHLTAGRRLYDKQEYPSAMEAYRLALAARGATRAQRTQAYAFLGAIAAVLGDSRMAKEAFRKLLLLEPGYRLADPSFSPKIFTLFDDVRHRLRRPPSAGLALIEPLVAQGRFAELRARAQNAGAATKVIAYARRPGATRYRRLIMVAREPGQYAVRVPARGTLEYYVEAEGDEGALVGRVGSASQPRSVTIGEPPSPPPAAGAVTASAPATETSSPSPWYRRWWVWTLAAAVVGGGVAGAVLATRKPDPVELPRGTLPNAQLP